VLDIAKPSIELLAAEKNYGRFKIEPLEPGYGHTLGNALRRVLLSSIEGAAVTKLKIEGVHHEFSTIPGVVEDVTEIVLNVKGIRFTAHARKVRVTLHRQGPGPVLARHMDLPSTVQLVNPDHYICTLDGTDSRVEMEFVVDKGKGYTPAEMGEVANIGEIPVDAIFTPIPKVNYVVENTRVGQATNYDRLILEIFTDGSVEPGDALGYAAQVLVEYNQKIADFIRQVPGGDIEDEEPALHESDEGAIPNVINEMPVSDLELSTRTFNCLRRADITTIGQILQMDEKQLKAVRNLGDKSLDEIKVRVREKCLRVGYDPGGRWSKSDDGLTYDSDDIIDADPEDETALSDTATE
jgi:DNA-directed RNA polymerase subunit alpha